MRYKLRPGLAWQTIGPETVVLDLTGCRSLGLNGTAGFVWSRIAESDDAEEVANELARAHGIPAETARADVARFVEALLARGLIEIA